MEQFKRDNYHRNAPTAEALKIEPVKDAELASIVGKLLQAASATSDQPIDVMIALSRRAILIDGVDLKNEQQGAISQVFERAGITPSSMVLIQWRALREIDRVPTKELYEHFYDIWYPDADDIELFDESMQWMLLIRHDGAASLWRPLEKAGPVNS